MTTVPTIMKHVVGAFGDRILGTISRNDMQDVLETKAGDLSGSMVAHLRWHLNAIFKLAVSDGLIDHNPAQELRVPKDCRPGRARRPLTAEEVNQYLGVLDLRERLMARLAIFEGLRPGEILALRWGGLESDAFLIRQRVYEGKPRYAKERENSRCGVVPRNACGPWDLAQGGAFDGRRCVRVSFPRIQGRRLTGGTCGGARLRRGLRR